MAPKFALFTKGSKLHLDKGFKNMFELLQSCAQPSIWTTYMRFCLKLPQGLNMSATSNGSGETAFMRRLAESLLVVNVISTFFSCAGSFLLLPLHFTCYIYFVTLCIIWKAFSLL